MKELNRMRLAAGIPIDGSIEITEKKVVASTIDPIMEAKAVPMTDFCLVGRATPDSELNDVYHCTNLRGMINIIKGSSKEDLEAMQVFHHNDHVAAEKLAKKLIKDAKSAVPAAVQESVVVESKCSKCEQLQKDDPDAQAAWKLKSQADQLQSSDPKLAQGQMSAAKSHLDKFNAKKADLKCDDCKKGATTNESIAAELNEFVIGAKNMGFASWEEDEKAATNAVAPNNDDVYSDNTRADDKDESPSQLEAPGDLGNATDAQGYDAEKKVMVPAKIKSLLKTEIAQAKKEGEKMNYSNREAAYFYDDLAAMFQDLLNHLEGGTVYDIKQAQIFMTGLMGPMLHKIPADVVNYIARGGVSASLKSYMTKV